MRVVQIGATLVGAQEKIETAVHCFLKDRGHESYILYAIGNSEDPDIIRYETRLDELLRRGLRKILGKNHRFAWRSTGHLLQELDRLKPDVVHLHTIHHGYLDHEKLFAYLAKKEIPVVYTLHDMWPFTGGCYYYTQVNCAKRLSGCRDCPQNSRTMDCENRKTVRMLERKLEWYKNLTRLLFVPVSDWVHQEAERSLIREYPQYTVLNAVEPTEHGKQAACREKDKIMLLGVAGSWDQRKGIERFFDLAKALGDQYVIVLVGSAGVEVQGRAPANIRFAGRISDKQQLSAMYATADAHVSMSMEETFGMTFVEAALEGTRSVGFGSTAIPQIVESVHGDVVKELTVDAMAEHIRRRSADLKAWKLSESEVRCVRERYSTARMAQEYLKVYEKALEQ